MKCSKLKLKVQPKTASRPLGNLFTEVVTEVTTSVTRPVRTTHHTSCLGRYALSVT